MFFYQNKQILTSVQQLTGDAVLTHCVQTLSAALRAPASLDTVVTASPATVTGLLFLAYPT
jgi:hypothetical protein